MKFPPTSDHDPSRTPYIVENKKAGWWLVSTHLKNICASQIGIIPPKVRDETKKHIFESTNQMFFYTLQNQQVLANSKWWLKCMGQLNIHQSWWSESVKQPPPSYSFLSHARPPVNTWFSGDDKFEPPSEPLLRWVPPPLVMAFLAGYFLGGRKRVTF